MCFQLISGISAKTHVFKTMIKIVINDLYNPEVVGKRAPGFISYNERDGCQKTGSNYHILPANYV
jgi:hypothetical protein